METDKKLIPLDSVNSYENDTRNRIIDYVRLGNIEGIVKAFTKLHDELKHSMKRERDLREENRILRDQLQKHGCFDLCEKRLQLDRKLMEEQIYE